VSWSLVTWISFSEQVLFTGLENSTPHSFGRYVLEDPISSICVFVCLSMLLAGYPSVVGSLWRVEDEYCPTVTKEVYRCMLGEDEKLDIRRSAEGLHRAVRCLREKTTRAPGFQINAPSKPLVWASFIHLGV